MFKETTWTILICEGDIVENAKGLNDDISSHMTWYLGELGFLALDIMATILFGY